MIKVVFELFSELVSALRIRDITLTTVLLIQLIGHRKADVLLFLEEEVVLLDEVVEHISFHHHVLGLIGVVVVPTETPINPKTMISDLSELISDLRHESLILTDVQFVPGRGDVDKSTDDTGLGVCDLDRLVSPDKQDRINSLGKSSNALLIYENGLMSDDAVEEPVGLDP